MHINIPLNFIIANCIEERSSWRSGVGSAMRAASQLSGRGPTNMDDAPACLSKI